MRISQKKSWLIRATYLSVIAFILFTWGPKEIFITSADIRIDCGDLRYNYFGTFHTYKKLPDSDRNTLLAIAKTSTKLPPEWTWVVYQTRNNPQLMAQDGYRRIAVWASIDPNIARFMMEDEAQILRENHYRVDNSTRQDDLSTHLNILIYQLSDVFSSDKSGNQVVNPNWRQNQDILDYCRLHNYVPLSPNTTSPTSPPGNPAASIVK